MKFKIRSIFLLSFICTFILLTNISVVSQNIILDKVIRAGELTLFQSVGDQNSYYYLPDQIRLAEHSNGTPKFSFLRYVENIRSGSADSEIREGSGGGIVHAVVSLEVSKSQLEQAHRALRRINASGRIEGPVIYQGGTVVLISSFANEDGDLTEQVVGLGKAPILDGQQAAVSIQLTKKGATLLWESFQSPTPDISFSFEMELTGYRSPKRAVIEANFDKIYDHRGFQAGIAGSFLAAEIKGVFDDLRQQGAIKLVQVGDDENMDELIKTAYSKLVNMMFDPLGGSGTPDFNQLASMGSGGQNILDRATTLLKEGRKIASEANERIRRENQTAREQANKENERIRHENQAAREQARTGQTRQEDGKQIENSDKQSTGIVKSAGENQADKSKDQDESIPANPGRPKRWSESKPTTPGSQLVESRPTDKPPVKPDLKEEVSSPPFAIAAAYEMKRIKHTGNFKIDLNKYTADNISMQFAENIGSINCSECFRQINLDDPLYQQREIVAFIDGLNAEDFGKYINFVTVTLEKNHEGGKVTHDEVRIDRMNFNREGNNFKMLYGWKNDPNRSRWLEYKHKTAWSFFGGHSVETDWHVENAGAINLTPPIQRRIVDLEADPNLLGDAAIRSINVRIFYDFGTGEQVKTVSLIPGKNQYSQRVEFMLPPNKYDYQYEITWRKLGATISSGRQKTTDPVLFVDEFELYQ